MKRFRLLLILTLIMLSYVSLIANVRVLSIGISDYPESSGWNKINAHNDVQLINALFPNARLLENSSATYSGIIAELKTLSNNASKGDTVIIHFSGHGQQIITHKSANEVDGVDEAIVPFDAAKRKSALYTGQNHLSDDIFGREIEMIRKTVGSNGLVIALIDACHSDSMDKATEESREIYRGTNEIFGTENMSDEAISTLRSTYHNQDTTALEVSPDKSNVVYLSACSSDQRNYEVVVEHKGYGSLTYYFCESYRKVGISDLPKFLSAIYSGMQNDYTLQFHGQLPAIRNTIGWQVTEKRIHPVPMPHPNRDDQTWFNSNILIWVIVSAVTFIIIISLWITRKKKI